MKLRVNESSVRLRLRRSEVERFREERAVESVVTFPGARTLTMRLIGAPITAAKVEFDGERIEIAVPAAEAARWAEGDAVGIYGSDGGLQILVEKDFRRTSAPSPDDSDRYPNPRSPRA